MTSTGMAVVVFVVCSILSMILLNQVQGKVSYIVVQPFPKVRLVSPVGNRLARLKDEMEQLIFYAKLLKLDRNASLTFSAGKVILEVVSYKTYEEAKSRVQIQYGFKPEEKITYVKMNERTFVSRASFSYKNISVIYRACIIVHENGQLLRDYNDAVQVAWKALNGEHVSVSSSTSPQILELLKSLAEKYSVEVVIKE